VIKTFFFITNHLLNIKFNYNLYPNNLLFNLITFNEQVENIIKFENKYSMSKVKIN